VTAHTKPDVRINYLKPQGHPMTEATQHAAEHDTPPVPISVIPGVTEGTYIVEFRVHGLDTGTMWEERLDTGTTAWVEQRPHATGSHAGHALDTWIAEQGDVPVGHYRLLNYSYGTWTITEYHVTSRIQYKAEPIRHDDGVGF
jgi:hypothetical protein